MVSTQPPQVGPVIVSDARTPSSNDFLSMGYGPRRAWEATRSYVWQTSMSSQYQPPFAWAFAPPLLGLFRAQDSQPSA